MSTTSRRSFLTAAVAGMASSHSFAQTLRKALATPANNATGTLADVEHVVILMQENRSFDHYFGTLAGVRGYSDPRPIALPSASPYGCSPAPPWARRSLPYHFDIRNTNALRVGLDHSWKGTEAAWKDWNVWVSKKSPRTMGYFDRSDLPFYYALADAFTVCDAYHCSIFGPTDPNRFYAPHRPQQRDRDRHLRAPALQRHQRHLQRRHRQRQPRRQGQRVADLRW